MAQTETQFDEGTDLPDRAFYKGIPISGKLFPPAILQRIEDNFQACNGDTIILGFPKSGTTWMQMIVWLLHNKEDIFKPLEDHKKNDVQSIWDLIPTLEMHPPNQQPCLDIITNMTAHRIYKCHLPSFFLEHTIAKHACKCLMMIRNPKDVQVSYYHFAMLRYPERSLKWNNWFARFMRNENSFGSWFDHVNGWLKQSKENSDKYHLIFYEELKANPEKVISGINQFLGTDCSSEELSELAKRTTIESMRVDAVSSLRSLSFMEHRAGHAFYRKGEVGDWKNWFSDEQAKVVDERIKQELDQDLADRYYQN